MKSAPSTAVGGGTSNTDVLALLAEQLDPLYRPARFLLGYAYLARGDAENAERIFETLTAPYVESLGKAAAELRSEWMEGKPRLGRVTKRLPVIRRWIQYWVDAFPFMMGGKLTVAAEAWADLKETLAEKPERDLSKEVQEHVIHSSLQLLDSLLIPIVSAEFIRAAVGRSDRYPTEQARAYLDSLLDPRAIRTFRLPLILLDIYCIAGEAKADELRKQMEVLRRGELGSVFDKVLTKIETMYAEKKWEECRKHIKFLRQYTTERDDRGFTALLDDPSVESFGAQVAGWFVPALRSLRKHRRELRAPLYTESAYHLALARLLSFEPKRLTSARREANELRVKRLPGSDASGPGLDLRLLTMCLEINCVASLLQAQDATQEESKVIADDGWRPEWEVWDIRQHCRPMLERALRDRKLSREVVAGVHTALGLIARIERGQEAERLERREQRSYDFQPNPIHQEMRHYREALARQETPTTHCYLAECLFELGSQQEGRAHLKQALSLAPMHKLALRLTARHEASASQ